MEIDVLRHVTRASAHRDRRDAGPRRAVDGVRSQGCHGGVRPIEFGWWWQAILRLVPTGEKKVEVGAAQVDEGKARNVAEGAIGRDEGIGLPTRRRAGEHRIKSAEGRVRFEKRKTALQIIPVGAHERCQQRHPTARNARGLLTAPTPGENVRELLNDLNGRRRRQGARLDSVHQSDTRISQWMGTAYCVEEDRRVENDHARRVRTSSSSRRKSLGSGRSICGAERMALAARRFSWVSDG